MSEQASGAKQLLEIESRMAYLSDALRQVARGAFQNNETAGIGSILEVLNEYATQTYDAICELNFDKGAES